MNNILTLRRNIPCCRRDRVGSCLGSTQPYLASRCKHRRVGPPRSHHILVGYKFWHLSPIVTSSHFWESTLAKLKLSYNLVGGNTRVPPWSIWWMRICQRSLLITLMERFWSFSSLKHAIAFARCSFEIWNLKLIELWDYNRVSYRIKLMNS